MRVTTSWTRKANARLGNLDSNTVFILRGEQVGRMPARPFREGVGSATLEEALQDLLRDHPDLISGDQISPNSADPPRFALLGVELTLDGRYSVDHVMVDNRGVPTIIETKLFENPESRRDVIGQILEYAALGLAEWGSGDLRAQASSYWSKRNRVLDDELLFRFGVDLSLDEFWDSVESNVQSGVIRLLIAGDQIRPDVRRVIELLNSEMRNIDVFGLELGCYGESGDEFVLVPRVIGQSIRTEDTKPSKVRPWSPDDLRAHYRIIAEEDTDRASRLTDLLDWAPANSLYVKSVAATPCFALGDGSGKRLVTVNPDGLFHWYVGESVYEDWGGKRARRHFYEGLMELDLAGEDQHPDRVESSRDLLRRIDELTSQEYERLLSLVKATIREASED
jgi:hypothetical protein